MKQARQGKKPNLGKTHTLEHRNKISAALKGRPKSTETIAKMVASRTGKKNVKKFSPESIIRRAETRRKNLTPELRQILSEKSKGSLNNFYGKTHSLETKNRLAEIDRSYLIGLWWWTDGINNVRSRVQPIGWTRGRTR